MVVKAALNPRSWEAAADLIRGWEASGLLGVVKADIPTVAEAVPKFFADATTRQLLQVHISKQKNMLKTTADVARLSHVVESFSHGSTSELFPLPQRDEQGG